jgi:hypothetical protein
MRKFAALIVIAFVASLAFTGCAAKGEKLWEKACNHAFDIAKKEAGKEGEKKEPTKEELDGAMKSCLEGFKAIPGAEVADEAANCMLGKEDLKGIGACMEEAAKKAAESKKGEEKKEEEKK